MSRRARMDTVKQVFGKREERAAQGMTEARRRLNQERERLSQLEQFRQSYGGDGDAPRTIDAFRLRDYNAFLGRLEDAIRQQTRQLDELERQARQSEQLWREQRQRVSAVEKVLDRASASERDEAERREQDISDELVAGRESRGN